MCEMCYKSGSVNWYVIDDNAEVELHPRCASALRKAGEDVQKIS